MDDCIKWLCRIQFDRDALDRIAIGEVADDQVGAELHQGIKTARTLGCRLAMQPIQSSAPDGLDREVEPSA